MAFLFSSSPSSSPSSDASVELAEQLRAMGFSGRDVRSVVSVVDADRDDALEIAIELLTRQSIYQSNHQSDNRTNQSNSLSVDRNIHQMPSFTDQSNTLVGMTGCTFDEARNALMTERGDLNAAAERLLARFDPSTNHILNQPNYTVQLEEEKQREQRRNELRLQARKKGYAELLEINQTINPSIDLKNNHSSPPSGKPVRFNQTFNMQRVSNDDFVLFDNEQRIRFVNQPPAMSSPAFSSTPTNQSSKSPNYPPNMIYVSPTTSSRAGQSQHSPPDFSLGVAHLSSNQSNNQPFRSLQPAPSPRSLALATIPQKSIPSNSSLQVNTIASSSFNSSFLTPSPLSAAKVAPNQSINQVTNHPIHKPRSFSSPRKSSQPFSFALPIHHRYELTFRHVDTNNPSSSHSINQPINQTNNQLDDEYLMTGDTVLIESFERCFLSVEANGSASINRMQPIDSSMYVIVHNEQSINQFIKQATIHDTDLPVDVYPVRSGEPIYLIAFNHNLISVDSDARIMVANQSIKKSVTDLIPCQWRIIPARFNNQPRRIRSTGPLINHSINQSTNPFSHWNYLKRNFRLIALSMLKQSINEKEFLLHSYQMNASRDNRAERALCTICLEREHDTVMMECGHLCACKECAQHLKECVVCRQPIARRVTIRT